ncbi:MAG: hypothetical protein NZL83_02670 [Candidatus Absconditabacterales bacterium]|nr:hypothetical protein [Candidatus Absconditabacterales bacterium]
MTSCIYRGLWVAWGTVSADRPLHSVLAVKDWTCEDADQRLRAQQIESPQRYVATAFCVLMPASLVNQRGQFLDYVIVHLRRGRELSVYVLQHFFLKDCYVSHCRQEGLVMNLGRQDE